MLVKEGWVNVRRFARLFVGPIGIVILVGRRNVWQEDLCLSEKPFDAVFLLAWGKAGRVCEGRSILLSLTAETMPVCTPEGAALVPRHRGVRVGCFFVGGLQGRDGHAGAEHSRLVGCRVGSTIAIAVVDRCGGLVGGGVGQGGRRHVKGEETDSTVDCAGFSGDCCVCDCGKRRRPWLIQPDPERN